MNKPSKLKELLEKARVSRNTNSIDNSTKTAFKKLTAFNKNFVNVKVKKLIPEAHIPQYETASAAGMDVIPTSVVYKPEIDTWEYHTGLSFELPEGYAMFILPRSSNRKTDAYMPNTPGLLDADYRGELLVCYKNRDAGINEPPYEINGKGIAQIVILPYPRVSFTEVDSLSETERGEGGFGSTDEKKANA